MALLQDVQGLREAHGAWKVDIELLRLAERDMFVWRRGVGVVEDGIEWQEDERAGAEPEKVTAVLTWASSAWRERISAKGMGDGERVTEDRKA